MKLNDRIDMKGRLRIRIHDREGELVRDMAADNDIVLDGRSLMAKLFSGADVAPISHIAVGTGTNKVNPGRDSELDREVFRKPINDIDPTLHITPTGDGKNVKVLITTELDFEEANGALTEAAIFNADTGGTMYNRVVFDEVNKSDKFKLTLIWEVIF